MKISFSLSARPDNTGHNQILLKINNKVNSKVVTLRAKSAVFISPEYFSKDFGINPQKFVRRRLETPELKYHQEQREKLQGLLDFINKNINSTDNEEIAGNWLSDLCEKYLFPNKTKAPSEDIYTLMNEFINKKDFAYKKGYLILIRAIARYEGFVRATDRQRKNFIFNYNKVTCSDLEDFLDYLRNEKELADENPDLFKILCAQYPANMKASRKSVLDGRGKNTTIKLLQKLRCFFKWLNEESYTTNNPFAKFRIGQEHYGTEPFYITIEERERIAAAALTTHTLETQRDIFVFQCFIGARVSDLIRLTNNNIVNGVLIYTPLKTKNHGEQSIQARVPLTATALKLINRYRGKDEKGRLFPFISPQKYNESIKEIFKQSGITRNVEVSNPKTGVIEMRPINEVASSHLARRTFAGNLYSQVKDPNLIGEMTGHVEGSKAFSRYRSIETQVLKETTSLLELPKKKGSRQDEEKRKKLLAAGFSEEQINVILSI